MYNNYFHISGKINNLLWDGLSVFNTSLSVPYFVFGVGYAFCTLIRAHTISVIIPSDLRPSVLRNIDWLMGIVIRYISRTLVDGIRIEIRINCYAR